MKEDVLNRTKVLRGSQLPQSKLTDDDVRLIQSIISDREHLRAQAAKLTNKLIAEKFDVHVRTIDKISCGESWSHITNE